VSVARVLVELLFFVGEGIDPSEDVLVGHGRLLAGLIGRSYDALPIRVLTTIA
jgi:hypothetical protein